MESGGRSGGGGGGGGGGNDGHKNINNNYFHYHNLQNHHSLFQATPPKTPIDRFLRSENNHQIYHSPQTIVPLSLQQNIGNNPSYYYNPNNITLGSSSQKKSSIFNINNNYHQNDGVYWPSQAQLNFSQGRLINLENVKWNEQINILDKSREDLDLCKKNGGGSGNNEHLIKGHWTKEEDVKLIELVKKHGVKKWSLVSNEIFGRAAKQCRERWNNHLRSGIKKEPWSEEEVMLLIKLHKKLENRWSLLAKNIPGRTENSIKNHWNVTKRKLDSRIRSAKRKPRPTNNQSTILEDYMMSYYSKKTTKSPSLLPTTTTPFMCTSEAIPTSIIHPNMTTTKFPSLPTTNTPCMGTSEAVLTSINMTTMEYDMFVPKMSDSINDQDKNTSSSLLSYDRNDEFNLFPSSPYSGNALVGSSSCIDRPKVGSTEEQLFHGNYMMNGFLE